MFFIFLVWGVFAGYFAGFLGIGAGVMLMPFLTLMGVPYHMAVDASLMAVFLSSVTGSIQNHRLGGIDWQPCVIIMIPGIITALIGSIYLIHIIPVKLLEVIFAGLMFLNVDLLRLVKNIHYIDVALDAAERNKRNFFKFVLIGILSGLMASLLGIGGGLLIVSLLIVLCEFSVKDAVKTSVVVMVETTFSSLISDMAQNNLPYSIGIPAALGAIAGSFLGTIALNYVSNHVIRNTNYVISYGLGFLMIFKIILT